MFLTRLILWRSTHSHTYIHTYMKERNAFSYDLYTCSCVTFICLPFKPLFFFRMCIHTVMLYFVSKNSTKDMPYSASYEHLIIIKTAIRTNFHMTIMYLVNYCLAFINLYTCLTFVLF